MKLDVHIVPFAIALFIGALIGLDRERRKTAGGPTGIGGIRTFILIAMAGALSAWLTERLALPWIFLTALLCVTAIIVGGHVVYALRSEEAARGLTTVIAAFITFLLGGLALSGGQTIAVALGIAASAILSYKRPIHQAIGKLGEEDVHAMLKLLIATFIVLPVLPDRPVDPWHALNPYKMWWLVILISAMSLVGYVASRWLGERRAVPLTGLFGGIVSSTVVALDFARRSRDATHAGSADALASGVLFSWSVMFVRIVIIIAALNLPMLHGLLPPMAAMGCMTIALALVFLRRSTRAPDEMQAGGVPLKNPFSLTSAMKFALFFAAVLLIVKGVEKSWQGQGLYAVATVAGLADVDAIALSMADYGRLPAQTGAAITAVIIAALTNTLVKCGIVTVLGRGGVKPRLLVATALVIATGAASILFAAGGFSLPRP